MKGISMKTHNTQRDKHKQQIKLLSDLSNQEYEITQPFGVLGGKKTVYSVTKGFRIVSEKKM